MMAALELGKRSGIEVLPDLEQWAEFGLNQVAA